MNISSSALRHRMPVAQKATQQTAAKSEESTTFSSGDSIGWGDAAVGLVSGLAGGVVTGVGAGVSSIKHAIIGTGEAYKSLWTNETIGPVLKTAMGTLMPIATVGVPILSAIGGVGVGLYRGFVEGATEGFSAAMSQSFKDVNFFNDDLAVSARNEIRDFGEEKLGDGQERFDISPVRGAAAVVAGVANTAVGAVGIGLSTASQVPEAFVTANRAISASDMGLPLKTVSHAVSLPLAVVAAPLGVVGGALFGLGSGAYYGYTDGLVDSFKKTGEHIGDYHKAVDDGLAKMAEDLVNDPS